jgi:hypothetical protein
MGDVEAGMIKQDHRKQKYSHAITGDDYQRVCDRGRSRKDQKNTTTDEDEGPRGQRECHE